MSVDIIGNYAPKDASYIVQTAAATLSGEQVLSSLPTGVVKVTTGTGVLSTAVVGTDYVVPSGDIGAATGTSLALTGAIGNLGDTTGASLSAAGGVVTIAGIGNTNNENLTINLESTSNVIDVGSSSGVLGFDLNFNYVRLDPPTADQLEAFSVLNTGGSPTMFVDNANYRVVAQGDGGNISYAALTTVPLIVRKAGGGGDHPASIAASTVALFQRSSASAGAGVTLLSAANASSSINFGDPDDEDIGSIGYNHIADSMTITVGAVQRIGLSATELVINEVGADTDFRVETDTEANAFVIDAGAETATFAVPVTASAGITQRIVTAASDATAVMDVDVTDVYQLTAMAAATVFTVTGTATDGQKLIVRLKDDGTGRALTWTAFTAVGVTLPATTTASKWLYVGATYNASAAVWHAIAVTEEA